MAVGFRRLMPVLPPRFCQTDQFSERNTFSLQYKLSALCSFLSSHCFSWFISRFIRNLKICSRGKNKNKNLLLVEVASAVFLRGREMLLDTVQHLLVLHINARNIDLHN